MDAELSILPSEQPVHLASPRTFGAPVYERNMSEMKPRGLSERRDPRKIIIIIMAKMFAASPNAAREENCSKQFLLLPLPSLRCGR